MEEVKEEEEVTNVKEEGGSGGAEWGCIREEAEYT